MVSFAQYIYPNLTEQIGGGKFREVQVIFAKDQLDTIEQFQIPTCQTSKPQSTLSKPLLLLFEGSEKYFLQIKEDKRQFSIFRKDIKLVSPLTNNFNINQKATDCPSISTTTDEKNP
jgi:hypothetical protein